MKAVQKLALQDSFDAQGVFIPAGHIGTFDADKIDGEKDKHLVDADALGGAPAMVQIAAIAPTGPNPVMPQQLPAGAVQGPGGDYLLPGRVLVAEATAPAEQRLDDRGLSDTDREVEVHEALAKIADEAGVSVGPATTTITGAPTTEQLMGTAENNDDALVNGTVADVTANLGAKSDAELDQLLAAENDREKPRVGVTSAIEAEQDRRKNA